jgi:hypothetical protein
MAAAASLDAGAGATGAFRLTAINDSGERVVAEPEGMSRVRELNGQLGDVVKTLNSKVSRVLHKQEAEFLSAYRGHMYSVQRELQSWKDKADAARLRHERDQRMQRLTEECAWFRKEALRLNKFNTGLKRDVQLLREKLNAVEEDRDWLDRQLKAAKKDNKLLRAELELRMTEPSADSVPMPDSRGEWVSRTQTQGGGFEAAAAAGAGDMESVLPPLTSAAPSSSPSDSVSGRMPVGGPGTRAAAVSPLRGNAASAGQLAKLEAKLAKQTAQLNAERAKSKRLRQAAVSDGGRRRELQRVLEQCVGEVRNQARRSRGNGAAASGGSAEGLSGGERRLVVQRLLEDDLVLEALHRTIFGREDRATSADGADSGGELVDRYDAGPVGAGYSGDGKASDEGMAEGSVRFASAEEAKSATSAGRGVVRTRLGVAGGLSLAGAATWDGGVPGAVA